MEQKRFRRLVRLAIAASMLLLAVAGWSQLRLRAVRLEIDALASETSELATQNERLRKQVESRENVRQKLRSEGVSVRLEGSDVGGARATVHLDKTERRALLLVEHLLADASCAYQLRIVPANTPALLMPFGVDTNGNVELLLDDLPDDIAEFRIERGADGIVLLSGRI